MKRLLNVTHNGANFIAVVELSKIKNDNNEKWNIENVVLKLENSEFNCWLSTEIQINLYYAIHNVDYFSLNRYFKNEKLLIK